MPIGSLKDLYFDELGDLYDAETQILRTLPRFAEAARAPELREALRKHCEESRLHLERLELIFTHWGERRRSRPCGGLSGIVQEADDRLNEVTTDDARDAAIIGAAQRVEHYEIAAYGCARTYARRLNRDDEARLLQETLDEEGRADHRLTEIAEAHINDDARMESDFAEPAPAGRLRFVRATDTADARSAGAKLPVRNEQDDDLGILDGVLVDTTERDRPRYAVVNGGGFFSQRRYLLPIDRLRLDTGARVLRVPLGKDVAERYPAFDADEFGRLNERDQRAYETRLLDMFPRGENIRSTGPGPEGEPEWWMTGAWVTVPPERADRLSDEARSFANEFAPRREEVVAREDDEARVRRLENERVRSPRGDKMRDPRASGD
jgi:ferritin-like metal-binding protein YciE